MSNSPAEDGSPVRAVAITAGRNVPSRRFRIKALVPNLERRGILLDELCPYFSSYPPIGKVYRLPWFAAAMAERTSYLWRANRYDVVILQRELISTLATLERWLPRPMVFDVDDAIFMHRNGVAARKISSSSSLIVCGNSYLAEEFSRWNNNIAIIPTGVDTDLLRPLLQDAGRDQLRIGWIGTAANFRYLKLISSALEQVLKNNRQAKLQIISNRFPEFLRGLGDQLDFKLWRPGIENELIPYFSVGIMPLLDDAWAKGKCAFKMLQYMAAGVPVVVSPVGVNAELLSIDDIGFGAVAERQWVDSLTDLLDHESQRIQLGDNGRRLAVNKFSLSVVATQWQQQLNRML
jgi:glycosyltransferase involved in cell wall biosynthesis